MSKKTIDIDAEFDDVKFNETEIKRRTSCLQSAKIRNQNPEYQANRKAMFESEQWKQNHDNAVKQFVQNPEWRANQKIAAEKRKNSKEWYDSFIEGNNKSVEKKHKNGTYQIWKDKMDAWKKTEEGQLASIIKSQKTKEMGKRNAIPVITPAGEFPSVVEAAIHYKIGKSSMSGRIKDHNDQFYFKHLGPGIAKRKKINK